MIIASDGPDNKTAPEPSPASIPHMLLPHLGSRADQPALGLIRDGRLSWRTWGDLAADVVRVCQHLDQQGIGTADRVAQVAANDYDWIVVDLAILLLRAIHVPLQPNLPGSELVRQANHCQAQLVIGRDSSAPGSELAAHPNLPPFVTTSQWSLSPADLSSHPDWRETQARWQHWLRRNSPGPDDVATLLFTSGTGGLPRAAVLTHGNLTSNVVALSEVASVPFEETRLLLLPLAHIYARTCDLYTWLYRGSRLILAESRETILRDCQLGSPTTINAVPYFYQKIADRIGVLPQEERAAALRHALGGAIRRCYSGGAATPGYVEEVFASAELPLLSGYGLTEASPVVTASVPESYEPGTVGRPLPNLEVELAADNEILVRGPSVTRGYWADQGESAKLIRDGWLHTGDMGQWTALGNLRIIGRKKELIVLSTGKNVWPAALETRLLASPLVEQVCLFGNDRPFLVAVIVPSREGLRREIRRRRWWIWTRRGALRHRGVRMLYEREVAECLSDAAGHERIGKFFLLGRGFSTALGELTPKLSLRREVIGEHFEREIAALYAAT